MVASTTSSPRSLKVLTRAVKRVFYSPTITIAGPRQDGNSEIDVEVNWLGTSLTAAVAALYLESSQFPDIIVVDGPQTKRTVTFKIPGEPHATKRDSTGPQSEMTSIISLIKFLSPKYFIITDYGNLLHSILSTYWDKDMYCHEHMWTNLPIIPSKDDDNHSHTEDVIMKALECGVYEWDLRVTRGVWQDFQ